MSSTPPKLVLSLEDLPEVDPPFNYRDDSGTSFLGREKVSEGSVNVRVAPFVRPDSCRSRGFDATSVLGPEGGLNPRNLAPRPPLRRRRVQTLAQVRFRTTYVGHSTLNGGRSVVGHVASPRPVLTLCHRREVWWNVRVRHPESEGVGPRT